MKLNENAVCFTGHRSEKLPKNQGIYQSSLNTLENEIKIAIDKGYSTFFTGMSYGFDLIAAANVLEFKKNTNVKIIAIVPFYGQEKNWNLINVKEYHRVLSMCDDIVVCHDSYRSGAYYDRNRYMVDSSSLVIAYSNGTGGSQYTVNYATQKGILVKNLYSNS